jgi:hypothetical protein
MSACNAVRPMLYVNAGLRCDRCPNGGLSVGIIGLLVVIILVILLLRLI